MSIFKIFSVLSVILLYFISATLTNASNLTNYLNPLSPSIWEINNTVQNSVYVTNGLLRFDSLQYATNSFPYIRSKSNIFDFEPPFSIEISFKYNSSDNFGAGIHITSGVPNAYWNNPIPYTPNNEIFAIWQEPLRGLQIYSSVCEEGQTQNCINQPVYSFDQIGFFSQHNVKIEYDNEGRYRILVDGGTNPVFVSVVDQNPPRGASFGNSIHTYTNDVWSSFEISRFASVHNIISNRYTVIVPGLGASWDMEALLSGTEGTNWQVPDFVKVYDGLINSFKNAGYSDTTDQNLYVFPYDWRRSLDSLADRLNLYINNLPLQPGEKIDLIGHSMGGLVARAYAQKYGVSKINKILTVGSPNMGTVKAYSIWEGAKLWDDVWWAKVALEMTTHFGATLGESKVKTLQRMAPSIKDLLPTYDYLVLNGNTLPWSSLKSKNTYLDGLNQNIAQINSLTTAIYSSDIQTDSLLNVLAPSKKDLLSNMWLDGKPAGSDPYIKANGDGTVVDTSAKGLFGNILQGNGWHGELVTREDNIKKIFGVLGLDQTKVIKGENSSNEQVFVAALRSPGKLEVCNIDLTKCNEHLGLYFPNNKLFIFPGYNDEKLRVTVTEDGQHGKYNLHLGNIDDDSAWTVVGGNLINDGQVDIYNIKSVGGNLSAQISPADKERCKRDGWRRFSFFNFRNQGDCTSFVDRFKKPFWWK